MARDKKGKLMVNKDNTQTAKIKRVLIRSGIFTVVTCLFIFIICQDFYLSLILSVFSSCFVFILSSIVQCLYFKIPFSKHPKSSSHFINEQDNQLLGDPFNPTSIAYIYGSQSGNEQNHQ